MKPMSIVTKVLGASISAAGKSKAKRVQAPEIPKAAFHHTAKARGKTFKVGFGKESIMPVDISKKKYYIAGYGMYKPATGILDTLYAHAVWIDDNSGKGGIVLVSLDAVGMLKTDVDIIKKYLKPFCAKTGCRNINFVCTHDHAGIDTMGIWGAVPRTGRTKEFMELVRDSIITACEKAYEDRREGALFHGTIEVPDMQEDIRLPKVYSKTLTRLRFVPNDGTRETYILNFASHSESLSSRNKQVSADFPSYLRKEIFEKTGAETVYCVGAIGGMISMEVHGQTMPERIEITKGLGVKLAGYATAIENERQLMPRISFIKQEFYFDAANIVLMTMAQLSVLQVKKYYSPSAALGYLLKSEMTYLEIDDLHMVFLPGEIFPELVYGGYLSEDESAEGLPPAINPVPLAQLAEDENLLVFGLANDEIGYMVPPNDFMLHPETPYLDRPIDRLGRRHYEETNSLGPDTAPKVAAVFTEMMETVKRTKAEQ